MSAKQFVVVAARFEEADFLTVQGGTLAGWKVVEKK